MKIGNFLIVSAMIIAILPFGCGKTRKADGEIEKAPETRYTILKEERARDSMNASLLAKQGINPDNLSFAQGKQLISEIFRRWDGKLCSFKQAKVLRKYGYDTEVSFTEASAMIDALAKNGWRREKAESREQRAEMKEGDPVWN